MADELNKVFITDAPRTVQTPDQLLGKVLELEKPRPAGSTAPPEMWQLPAGVLLQAVNTYLAGPNNRRDLRKAVIFFSSTSPFFKANDTALDTLAGELCLNTVCTVEFGDDGTYQNADYVLRFDSTGPLSVFRDGSFQGDKVPARWFRKDTPAAQQAGIESFNPNTTKYPAGSKVVYDARIWTNSQELVRTSFPEKVIPAPDGDNAFWSEISRASPTMLFQRVGLALLRDLLGELVEGRQYEIVRPGGNVFVQVLGDSGSLLSPLVAWLNPDTNTLQPALYDVAKDEISALDTAIAALQAAAPYQPGPGARVLYVAGWGQTGQGERGNPYRPYPTIQLAYAAGTDGDVMIIAPGGSGTAPDGQPGYVGAAFSWDKKINAVCLPGVNILFEFNFGGYSGSVQDLDFYWKGGTFWSAFVCFKQNNSAAKYTLTGAEFRGAGFFYAFDRNAAGAQSTLYRLRDCRFYSIGVPAINHVSRDDQNPSAIIELDNTLVAPTGNGAVNIRFTSNPNTKVVLKGTTELRTEAGRPRSETAQANPGGTQQVEADWLVDERPAGGSAPVATTWPPLTNPLTDDAAKVLRATLPDGIAATDCAYTLDSGATYTNCTAGMQSGNDVLIPVSGAKAAGTVGVRVRAGGGKTASATVYNPLAFTAPAAPLVWQEDNAGITYAGAWTNGDQIEFYGSGYRRTVEVGATASFAMPAGYTAFSMQGHKDTGGSYYEVTVDGVQKISADQYEASSQKGEYLRTTPQNRIVAVAGDVVVFRRIANPGGGGTNVSNFIDQITFHP